MIINDTHRFAFIHIPKCAGTTVRSRLQLFDEAGGAFASVIGDHVALGTIDYAHIPLSVLEQYFPSEYAKVCSYQSFALVRNPFDRFSSALSQHLRMYGKAQIQNLSITEIEQEIHKAIDVLLKYREPSAFLPYRYIHFQRQADYIYSHQVCVVKHLFLTSQTNDMLAEIERDYGFAVENGTPKLLRSSNQTLVYRNSLLRTLSEAIKPLVKKVLGDATWIRFREHYRKHVFVPRDDKLKKLFEEQYCRDFISDYYADDIKIYEGLRDMSVIRHER